MLSLSLLSMLYGLVVCRYVSLQSILQKVGPTVDTLYQNVFAIVMWDMKINIFRLLFAEL